MPIFFVEPVVKALASDGFSVNWYVLFSAGFSLSFLNLSARKRLDSVFYVSLNKS